MDFENYKFKNDWEVDLPLKTQYSVEISVDLGLKLKLLNEHENEKWKNLKQFSSRKIGSIFWS